MTTDDLNIQFEYSLIGSVLTNNDSFDEINTQPDEFFIESNRIIFSAIQSILNSGKPVDLIILAEQLERDGKLEYVGGLKCLGDICQSSFSQANIKSYAKKIKDAFHLRSVKKLLCTLDNAVTQNVDSETIIELAESGFDSVCGNDSKNNLISFGTAARDALDWQGQEHKGFMTGLRDLDRMVDGFKKSDLILIAARPSMGKSALAGQIAEHVANKEPVIFFSLEMTAMQVASRSLSYHTPIIGASEALKHMDSLKLVIDPTPSVTIGHIKSKCRKVKRQSGLGMIVVDYVQLMRGEGDNRNQEIGSISRGLKAIAKEFDIPVVALSQLNRKVDDRADRRPQMSDLRESGELEQDADMIIFVYRDDMYRDEKDGLAELIIRKNRNGSTGDVMTRFDGPTTRFCDTNERKAFKVVGKKSRGFDDI